MARMILFLLMSATVLCQPHPAHDLGDVHPGISFASARLDWSQTLSTRLISGARERVTLTPCPAGIDTRSGAGYQVLLSGGGHSEAANVLTTSDGCISGAASGTITLIPFFSYPEGSTISSASSGIQEAINVACGVDSTPWKNNQCNLSIPANGPQVGPEHSINTYNVYGTIFFHSNQSMLSGYGASLNCLGRGPCVQIGNLKGSNDFAGNTIAGLSFRSPKDFSSNPSYHGVRIVATRSDGWLATVGDSPRSWCASHPAFCTRTITTATAHGFRPGDLVTVMFTDDAAYWGDAIVYDCGSGTTAASCTSTSTTFRYQHTTGTTASQTTPGVVALAYVAILDNGNKTNLTDIQYDKIGESGAFNQFFDFWDDENAVITRFGAVTNLNGNEKWTGSFIFSAGNQGPLNQIAPVITMRDSTITALNPAVTVYNSNNVYIENSVVQSSGPWQFYTSNATGNYGGIYLKNIYSESSTGANPLSPARSPFAGTGIAGLIVGPSSGAAQVQIQYGGVQGSAPSYGKCPGAINFTYYIVVHDTTTGAPSSPLLADYYCSTGNDSPKIYWPRVANGADAITYDVIRTESNSGAIGAQFPAYGTCTGGSRTACGSVAIGVTQAMACRDSLVCSYTDKATANTSPYSFKWNPFYQGNVAYWPGTIVTVNRTIMADRDSGGLVGVGLAGIPLEVANYCLSGGQTGPGGNFTVCNATRSDTSPAGGTILDDEGTNANIGYVQGRLNFSNGAYQSVGHDIVTLINAKPQQTKSTIGFRPLANASDTAIGTDMPTNGNSVGSEGQLAFRAPVSISSYINTLPNNTGYSGAQATNWLERLTTGQKTFAVPVKIEEGSSLTVGNGSPLTRITKYTIDKVGASRVPSQTCNDVDIVATGVSKSDQIAALTPPGALGNLSVNAYPAAKDAVTLHFCNSSTSEALIPTGTYSFLAVR